MIGRDRELRDLQRLAASRRPRVAMVSGEPGIGKTRLIQEFLATLGDDTVVLVGQAEPGSLSRPYEVLMDALDSRDDVDPEQLAALADASRSPVERLHAGVRLVGDLVGDRPAVLVFEDLHWADSESAALFERLADLDGPRLLVGTYRPAEVTGRDPVSALLARLDRRHEVTRIGLERFAEADTAALLAALTGRPAPVRAVAALHQRTGGNPFFLEELLRGHEGEDLESVNEQPLPWSLAEVLRRQVDDLSADDGRIVEAAAVLGHRVHFDLLAAVTGVERGRAHLRARAPWSRATCSSRPAKTSSASGTRCCARRSPASCIGRQRRRLHEAALEALLADEGRPAAARPGDGRPPRPGGRALRRHGRGGPARRRALPVDRFGLPDARARRDGPRRGRRRPGAARRRRPRRLAGGAARRRDLRTPGAGATAPSPPPTAPTRST